MSLSYLNYIRIMCYWSMKWTWTYGILAIIRSVINWPCNYMQSCTRRMLRNLKVYLLLLLRLTLPSPVLRIFAGIPYVAENGSLQNTCMLSVGNALTRALTISDQIMIILINLVDLVMVSKLIHVGIILLVNHLHHLTI